MVIFPGPLFPVMQKVSDDDLNRKRVKEKKIWEKKQKILQK